MTLLSVVQEERNRIVATAREHAEIMREHAAEADRTRVVQPATMDILKYYFGFMANESVGMTEYALLMSELGKGDPSAALGLCMHHFAMGEAQRPEVDRKIREKLLALGSRYLISALVSEPGSSSGQVQSFVPSSLEAEQLPDGSWVLNGKKHFGTFGQLSTYTLVYAHIKGSENPLATVALLVDTSNDSIEFNDIWHTHGMRSTMSNPVKFTNVPVPADNLVYQTDDYIRASVLERGAQTFGYLCVYQGVGERILELAKMSLSTRVAKGFTQVIGYDPSVAEAVADCETRLHGSRLQMMHAMTMYDEMGPGPQTLPVLLMAKVAIGEAVAHVSKEIGRRMGGTSLLTADSPVSDGEFERLLRDGATAGIMPISSDSARRLIGYMAMGLDPSQAPSLR